MCVYTHTYIFPSITNGLARDKNTQPRNENVALYWICFSPEAVVFAQKIQCYFTNIIHYEDLSNKV